MSDNDKPQVEPPQSTLALSPETPVPPDQMEAQEARMRRALGLNGESVRLRQSPERADTPPRQMERFTQGVHKRRFVQDGEVPVTIVHGLTPGRRDHPDSGAARNGAAAGPTNRLEVAELALAAEIASRDRAEKALAEAQATIHDLQTKFGHAELAQQESAALLRHEKEANAELHAAMEHAEERIRAAQDAQAEAERALAAALTRSEEEHEPAQVEQPRRRRGRPPGSRAAGAVKPAVAAAKVDKSAEAAPAREPKLVRWWIKAKRASKKR